MKNINNVKKSETKYSRLPMEAMSFFDDSDQFCIADLAYFRSHVNGGRWACRFSHFQDHTPVRRLESVKKALERLVGKVPGFRKEAYGNPQSRRKGKGKSETEIVQSYQVVFDVIPFEEWLKVALEKRIAELTAEKEAEAIQKRIDPYPKTDSLPIQKRIEGYPKTDTKENSIENTGEGVGTESTVLNYNISGSVSASVSIQQAEGDTASALKFDSYFDENGRFVDPSLLSTSPVSGQIEYTEAGSVKATTTPPKPVNAPEGLLRVKDKPLQNALNVWLNLLPPLVQGKFISEVNPLIVKDRVTFAHCERMFNHLKQLQ